MNASAPLLPGAGRFSPRLALGAVLALTLMLLPGAAIARADTPQDFSAGDQYVETLPTAKGPKATETAPKHKAGSGLSPSARQALETQGGSDTATLEYVATAPELGAPVTAGSGSVQDQNGSGASKKHKRGASSGSGSVPSAAINA